MKKETSVTVIQEETTDHSNSVVSDERDARLDDLKSTFVDENDKKSFAEIFKDDREQRGVQDLGFTS